MRRVPMGRERAPGTGTKAFRSRCGDSSREVPGADVPKPARETEGAASLIRHHLFGEQCHVRQDKSPEGDRPGAALQPGGSGGARGEHRRDRAAEGRTQHLRAGHGSGEVRQRAEQRRSVYRLRADRSGVRAAAGGRPGRADEAGEPGAAVATARAARGRGPGDCRGRSARRAAPGRHHVRRQPDRRRYWPGGPARADCERSEHAHGARLRHAHERAPAAGAREPSGAGAAADGGGGHGRHAGDRSTSSRCSRTSRVRGRRKASRPQRACPRRKVPTCP